MTTAERHEHQHRLVSERECLFRTAPKRKGADKVHRRELDITISRWDRRAGGREPT